MKMRRKGYVHSIEMLIAMSIILVALVITFKDTAREHEVEVTLLKRYAWGAMEYLDYNRNLREYIADDNESIIENNLKAVLPENFIFEIDICSAQCDDSNVPKNETIVVVDYYLSGYRNTFLNKKVKLWVWT